MPLLIASNGTTGDYADCQVDWGLFDTTAGYNLDSDGTCVTDGVDNNITSATPGLDGLADNGGSTQTHALDTNSPALNAIPSGTNGCGST